ncbi:hypothetical protein [Halapricum salinum]|uniref:Uncharacterized protein n=1 Tax=Halapricum salinum TaxID=1457250 RepID=A0A4D6HDJ5_9EURY|nr:hypothetical protein [Halapricum salinum]QCC51296.1 hypothetical protein DV733_08570 [Halapricum salinum]
MEDWVETLLRLSSHTYLLAAVVGLGVTLLWARPGSETLRLGPLALDLYYITLGTFGLLFVLSLTHDHDPEVYARGSDEESE